MGESYRNVFEKELIRFKLFDIVLEAPWRLVHEDEKAGLVKELRKELNDDHVLKNVFVRAIARSDASDDVLFELEGDEYTFAQVHLTWSGKQEQLKYPKTKIYNNIDEWLAATKPIID
ncbi:hypothetical protein ACFQZT_12730 [Paenibacillus sp. GCM10027628]|uniref:hypothetical protein n=1 Tax=Paenibacillus sp. GCM10027628 TaxID=3273413 RepID=UPI00363ACCCA